MSLQDKILKRKLKKKENQKLKILKNRQQENDKETEESSEVPVSDVENQTVAKRKHEAEEIGTVPLKLTLLQFLYVLEKTDFLVNKKSWKSS